MLMSVDSQCCSQGISLAGLNRSGLGGARPGELRLAPCDIDAAEDDEAGPGHHQPSRKLAENQEAEQCRPDKAGVVEGRYHGSLTVAKGLVVTELAETTGNAADDEPEPIHAVRPDPDRRHRGPEHDDH